MPKKKEVHSEEMKSALEALRTTRDQLKLEGDCKPRMGTLHLPTQEEEKEICEFITIIIIILLSRVLLLYMA